MGGVSPNLTITEYSDTGTAGTSHQQLTGDPWNTFTTFQRANAKIAKRPGHDQAYIYVPSRSATSNNSGIGEGLLYLAALPDSTATSGTYLGDVPPESPVSGQPHRWTHAIGIAVYGTTLWLAYIYEAYNRVEHGGLHAISTVDHSVLVNNRAFAWITDCKGLAITSTHIWSHDPTGHMRAWFSGGTSIYQRDASSDFATTGATTGTEAITAVSDGLLLANDTGIYSYAYPSG